LTGGEIRFFSLQTLEIKRIRAAKEPETVIQRPKPARKDAPLPDFSVCPWAELSLEAGRPTLNTLHHLEGNGSREQNLVLRA